MEDTKTIMIKDSFSELGAIQRAFTPEQVKFVMEAVAPGLNEKEVWLFLLKANVLKLNPLLGEIFAYAYTDRQTGQRRLVVIEGRNGKRNLAAKTGKIESIKTEAIYIKEVSQAPDDGKLAPPKMYIRVEPWDGTLWGATCTIKVQGKNETISETVKLSEYDTKKSVWLTKPETMIKKVAESQALSSALPGMMLDLIGEGENFAADQPKALTALEDGTKPATEQQLATLKAIKHDFKASPVITKQDAANAIEAFYSKKGGKKS